MGDLVGTPLSPRQREVLSLLDQGAGAREIARRLSLSEVTVRNHISGLLHRLGSHSQVEALAAARRLRLL